MQVHLTDKVECTGCSACYAICPQNCIEMKFDHHGFKHPVINTTSCINCYKCSEVCPVLNRKKQENTINKKFAAWTHNEDLRYQSTSGGIFSEMAAEIIENGGFIVAASYNELNEVEHVMIEDFESLPKLRQIGRASCRERGLRLV